MKAALLLLSLLSLSTSVQAARFTVDDAGEMVGRLAPQIAVVAGRDFVELPPVDIATRAQLSAKVTEQALGEGEAAVLQQRVAESLAMYFGREGKIYLIDEAIEELFAGEHPVGLRLDATVAVVMAHELAHALEHQWADSAVPQTTEQAWVGLMHSEGFATLVEARWCDRWGDWMACQALGSTSAPDLGQLSELDQSDTSAVYLLGGQLHVLIEQTGGIEANWAALQGPVPSTELIDTAMTHRLAGSWGDPAWMDTALEDFELGPTARGEGQRLDESDFAGPMFHRLLGRGIEAVDGRVWTLEGRQGDRIAVALRLRSSEPAALLVAERRRQVTHAQAGRQHAFFLGDLRGADLRMWARLALPELPAGPRLQVWANNDSRSYRENWAALDDVLVLTTSYGQVPTRKEQAASTARLLQAVASIDEAPRDAPPEFQAWLSALPASTPATISASFRTFAATRALLAGYPEDCVLEASAGLARAVPGTIAELGWLVRTCEAGGVADFAPSSGAPIPLADALRRAREFQRAGQLPLALSVALAAEAPAGADALVLFDFQLALAVSVEEYGVAQEILRQRSELLAAPHEGPMGEQTAELLQAVLETLETLCTVEGAGAEDCIALRDSLAMALD